MIWSQLINQIIDAFSKAWYALDNYHLLIFLKLGPWVVASIAIAKASHRLLKIRLSRKKLLPFYTEADIRQYTKRYVEPGLLLSPPKAIEEFSGPAEISLKIFTREIYGETNDQRFFIILGDSGMGKTAFLINFLYNHYSIFNIRNWNSTVKLFKVTDGLIGSIRLLRNTVTPDDTILLLDGFDEDRTIVDPQARIAELYDELKDFKRVIMACRTQFYPSKAEREWELPLQSHFDGGGHYHLCARFIAPFSNIQVKKYLRLRYKWYRPSSFARRKLAYRIVTLTPKLMLRPMILAHINDIIEEESYSISNYLHDQLASVLRMIRINPFRIKDYDNESISNVRGYQYAYEVYNAIVSNWIKRESKSRRSEEQKTQFQKELWNFSAYIAVVSYNQNRQSGTEALKKEDLIETSLNNDMQFELLNEYEFTNKALITKNDDGNWIFAHRSIYEYLLSLSLYHLYELNLNIVNFDGLDMCRQFVDEACLKNHTIPCFSKISSSSDTWSISYSTPYAKKRDFTKLTLNEIQQITSIEFPETDELESFLSEYPEVLDGRTFFPLKKLNRDTLLRIANIYLSKELFLARYFFLLAKNGNDDEKAVRGLASFYVTFFDYDSAISEYRELLKSKYSKNILRQLGDLLSWVGKSEDAEKYLVDYYDIKKGDSKSYEELARHLFKIGEVDLADKYLTDATKDGCTLSPSGMWDKAKAAQVLSHFEEAIEWYEKALSFEGWGAAVYKLFVPEIVTCYYLLGRGDYGITSTLERVFNEHRRTFEANLFVAEQYASIGQVEDAIKYAEKARLSKDSDENYSALATFYRLYIRDYKTAKSYYEIALKKRPEESRLLNGLGLIYKAEKNFNDAFAFINKAFESSRDRNYIRSVYCANIGLVYYDQDKNEQASVYFEKALSIDPQNKNALYYGGIIENNIIKRLKHFEQLVRLNPYESEYYYWLGASYSTLQKLEYAVHYLKKAIRYNPSDQYSLELLATLTKN